MADDKSTSWTRRQIIRGAAVTAVQALLPAARADRLSAQGEAGAPAPGKQSPEPKFVSAQPVWPKGLEREKNLFVGFRASFEAADQHPVLLRVTGSTATGYSSTGLFAATDRLAGHMTTIE